MAEGLKNRERVRQALIDPLIEAGMRFPKGTPDDEARRRLDQMADDLGYMTDSVLTVLGQALRGMGGGARRNFWPSRVAVIGLAEAFCPRPIEELPAMASWFGSVEGPRAREAGTLLPTYLFIKAFKRPPVNGEADFLKLRVDAMWWHDLADEIRLARDRVARGVAREGDDRLMAWVAAHEAKAEALIKAGEDKREGAA